MRSINTGVSASFHFILRSHLPPDATETCPQNGQKESNRSRSLPGKTGVTSASCCLSLLHLPRSTRDSSRCYRRPFALLRDFLDLQKRLATRHRVRAAFAAFAANGVKEGKVAASRLLIENTRHLDCCSAGASIGPRSPFSFIRFTVSQPLRVSDQRTFEPRPLIELTPFAQYGLPL